MKQSYNLKDFTSGSWEKQWDPRIYFYFPDTEPELFFIGCYCNCPCEKTPINFQWWKDSFRKSHQQFCLKYKYNTWIEFVTTTLDVAVWQFFTAWKKKNKQLSNKIMSMLYRNIDRCYKFAAIYHVILKHFNPNCINMTQTFHVYYSMVG